MTPTLSFTAFFLNHMFNTFKKIKAYFKREKLRHIAEKEIEKEKTLNVPTNFAERLALSTCSWVKLQWNGKEEEFLINNLNIAELAMSGKYPNVMLYFIKSAKKQGANLDTENEDVDIIKMKKEE